MHKPHLRYKDQTPRERTWTIHFISVMKFVKAVVLIAIGIKLLSLFGRDVHDWAEDFVTRHGIDTANKLISSTLAKLEGVGNAQIVTFSVVAFCYSGLLLTEGIGLWLQKRWAEYLTAIATFLFIPIELYELYERFTWVRIGILALNIFIVWYLFTRLRDEKKEVLSTETTEDAETGTVRVKICGITNLEDALVAVGLGADELGFNFFGESSRYIEPAKVKKIIARLPEGTRKVGVFVNESIERILEVADEINLDVIQLHGDEDEAFIRRLRKRTNCDLVKAIRVKADLNIAPLLDSEADAVLLDSYSDRNFGGTGTTFDWTVAENAGSRLPRIYLAGGLTAENVAEGVRRIRPYAVDVASGVESSPGKKDPEKVAAFIKAAKEAI